MGGDVQASFEKKELRVRGSTPEYPNGGEATGRGGLTERHQVCDRDREKKHRRVLLKGQGGALPWTWD